jgi:hypothetical protein
MRKRDRRRRRRTELLWIVTGVVLAQPLLGLIVDRCGRVLRDPEYCGLAHRLTELRSEELERPLVVALGSSRTVDGLDAGRVCCPTDPTAPLVFNFGIPFGGPMMDQIALRRLLADGVVPDLVVVEVMLMSLSGRGSTALEERQLDPARLDAEEAIHLTRYYARPVALEMRRWSSARLVPILRHQAELRQAIGLDPVEDHLVDRDRHGWRAQNAEITPERAVANVHGTIDLYDDYLSGPIVPANPLRALEELINLCKGEQIAVVLVYPPECSAFRQAHTSANDAAGEIRRLVVERHVPLYDARSWVNDSGFSDGIHLIPTGAAVYTDRLDREVLRPELHRLRSVVQRGR